jgi:two-component system sensor histidine kinase HydH
MRTRRIWPIAGPMFLSSLVLFILGAGAGWYFHVEQRNVSFELSEKVTHVLAAEELVLAIREIRGHVARYIIDGDRTALTLVPPCIEKVHRVASGLKGMADEGEQLLLKQLEDAADQFATEVARTTATSSGDKLTHEIARLRNIVIGTMMPPAAELLELNHGQINEVDRRNVIMSNRMSIGLFALGICGGLAGLLGGFGMSRAINRNLVQLSVPIRSVAGKLDEVVGPLTLSAGHSFEEVNELLEQMAVRVGDVVQHLHESRQQAMRAEQLAAVGQLAAGLAHELRNPLTSVKILVQSAAERPLPGLRSPRDLAVLEEEIGRMEQLITTFLDFARPPSPKKRWIDLRADVEHVLTVVRPRAERIGVEFSTMIPERPLMLAADSMQMRQLLMNLALNAVDATGANGHVWLSIDDDETEPPANGSGAVGSRWLNLRVSDDGRGLPHELGEKIFDPFVSTKETGIGLGLSISKRIVETHGGTIEAIERPGGGAIFIVRLPMAPMPAESPAIPLAVDAS